MRKLLTFGLLSAACLLNATGCRMCCPSYDYCEPMGPFGPNDETCGCGPRYGSAFGGHDEYVEEGTYVDEGAPLESSPMFESYPAPGTETAAPPPQALRRPMPTSPKVAATKRTR